MTEKKTDTIRPFENEYAYVTESGDIRLKKTSIFDERTIAAGDPESIEQNIQALENAFEQLRSSVDVFFEELENLEEAPEKNAAEEKFSALLEKIKQAEAIGDFEALADEVKIRFEKLFEPKEPLAEEPSGEEEQEPAKNAEDAEMYYKELAEKAETFLGLSDWAYATMEFDNLEHAWEEGPDPDGTDIKPYRKRIDELREQLEEKKRAHYEEQKKIREENLARKKEILDSLKEIVEKEQWAKTKAVARLKGRWDNIRPVPAESQEKLEADFQTNLTTFDEHKVDRLVKQKQQEEDNLTGKLVILEKMDLVVAGITEKTKNWNELNKSLDEFAKQFKKIGRVPAEKNQGVWDRFHTAQDTFHSLRFKYDKTYRKNIEKFLTKKKKLIDEAETLVDMENIAKAARKVNKLHRQWKKAGNLPQKEENELWDRFKAATDTFNDKKTDNMDVLREQEEQNYDTKLSIIKRAEELKESEQWEDAHKEFQRLMDQWKAVGPVPRRKSGKIWDTFKAAMDHFYERRRSYLKEVKEERKDNLREKETILEKLNELASHENPVEAVELAKPLQEEFKKAGYVPIKHKNRMWKEYREVCDVLYDRFRAAKSAAQIVGKENVENFSADDITEIKHKQELAGKIRKEIHTLSNDLIQMKESLSYFKPSGSGSSLLDEVRGRIDKAEAKINAKEDQLEKIELEIDKIKREA